MVENESLVPDLNEEVAQEAPQEEIVESPEENVQKEAQQLTQQELNARILRKRADEIARERDEALKRLREYESMYQQRQPEPQKQSVEDYSINPDDLVEGKHLSKYDRKMKELEDRIANYQRQMQAQTAEQLINNQYPDFKNVVNENTVKDLKAVDPDLAASIALNPDPYSQAKAAYNAIKRYGIYQEDLYAHDRMKAQKNAAKPKTAASISPQQGESPLANAHLFGGDITEEQKAILRKEMLECARRR